MSDGRSDGAPLPGSGARGRWNGFAADEPRGAGPARGLHEPANPRHRARVEFDGQSVFVHLSDEDGHGWTCLAVDRATREWAVARRETQGAAARSAHRLLREQPAAD